MGGPASDSPMDARSPFSHLNARAYIGVRAEHVFASPASKATHKAHTADCFYDSPFSSLPTPSETEIMSSMLWPALTSRF